MPASWVASALVVLVLAPACAGAGSAAPREHAEGTTQAAAPPAGLAVATFAGGCFWCMEPPFEAVPGVLSVTSGYTGAEFPHPTYQQVSSGGTGHAEAVRVVFDPATIGYERLLEVFWRNVDPLAVDRQFCDAGTQYRSAIFVHDEAQRSAAERSKRELAASGRLRGPIATEIAPAGPFWVAEEEHQDYSRKDPTSYRLYRSGCGRDRRLAELWGEAPTAH